MCQFVQGFGTDLVYAHVRKCKSTNQDHVVSMCRLSKKIHSEIKNETIDWLELKHAVEKERNISCKCLPLSHLTVN